ncbi:hypothetical protein Q9F39_004198 [Vibrio fluvialis]|nr:hypothetical protein [Vibrio fluvialis]
MNTNHSVSASEMNVSNASTPSKRTLSSGNRCGHNKDCFIVDLKRGIASNYPIIIKTMINSLLALKSHAHQLKGLWKARNSHRKMRSERRESMLQTLSALLKFADIESGHVGRREGGYFDYVSFRVIWASTDLSWTRFKRAIRDLVACGYLVSHERNELKEDGSRRALVSVKKLTSAFFKDLGFDSWRQDEKSRAKTRNLLSQHNRKLSLIRSRSAGAGKDKPALGESTRPNYMSLRQEDLRRAELSRQIDILSEKYNS